ncbi:phage tail tip lysozyme [Agrobacterium tumefaciens]|uniref:phage tail tip lysozyme n=1 Tax=Agrobacterium tumefaciens TaxID=358 RepID=UPI0021CE9EC0|nr:phage tail tip lysozyme [Agrobacterium tumefaciens]
MAGFIFGGNTGDTPETLRRKRSLAEALAVKTSSAPRNVGEGLNALGNALIYRALMGKVNAGEAEGKKAAANDEAAFFSSFGSPASTAAPASSGIPMTDAAGEVSATSPKVAASGSGNVYEDFIGGVKSAGLTNPYGLAAVAATGQAESGWSPQNANRSWSDPSQSGQAGTAGGVMSWRNERLNNLYNFARQRGEEPGNISPATQAAFFVQEDPSLIQSLNSAKSAEEAQRLMNNAWKFAGYDQPGGETARRMGLASSYVPRFQGGNTEVASLDPSAGMSAADAIKAVAPQSGGYRDPMVSAPNSRGAVANALMAPAPQAAQPSPVVAALASPQASPAVASDVLPVGEMASTTNAAVAPRNQTVAQALSSSPRQPEAPQYYPAAPTPPGQSGPSLQQIMQVINNPYSSEGSRAYAQSLLEQRQKQSDPSYQLEQEYKRAQLEALREKPAKTWQKLDDTTLFNPETGETQRVNAPEAGNGQFRFKGNSVDAQALNGLMDAGQLTPDQAQQIAAGKTVTGPNGEIIFMTPQGVFGQSTDGTLSPMSAPQGPTPPAPPQSPGGVDIFGGGAPAAPTPPAPPSPPQAPKQPQAAPQRQGMIPLTQPKVTVDESKAGGFADRMTQSGTLIDKFGNAGLSTFDQAITNSPYVPGFIANNLVGDEFQQYDQARRDFINAQLRRESGAVISPEEFDNANRQYFPQPGDKPEVLEQKRKNRETVIGAMIRDAGPTYKRPAGGDGAPSAGQVVDGYRFKGGDPAQQSNWEKVQ